MRPQVSLTLEPGIALTEQVFEGFVARAFREMRNHDTLTLLVTPKLATILDLLAGDRLATVPEHQSLGIPTKQWVTMHGVVNIVKLGGVSGTVGMLIDPVGVIR